MHGPLIRVYQRSKCSSVASLRPGKGNLIKFYHCEYANECDAKLFRLIVESTPFFLLVVKAENKQQLGGTANVGEILFTILEQPCSVFVGMA
jgi:hypothetical protein